MRSVLLGALVLWTGCGADVELPPPLLPTVSTPEMVVPSAGLPVEVTPQNANNNLDVAYHDGRVFLAFRTSPTHFASEDTVLYVVSSTDQVTWQYEGEFWVGTDIREPQLVSFNGQLVLYFALLGVNPWDFEPIGTRYVMYGGVPGACDTFSWCGAPHTRQAQELRLIDTAKGASPCRCPLKEFASSIGPHGSRVPSPP